MDECIVVVMDVTAKAPRDTTALLAQRNAKPLKFDCDCGKRMQGVHVNAQGMHLHAAVNALVGHMILTRCVARDVLTSFCHMTSGLAVDT